MAQSEDLEYLEKLNFQLNKSNSNAPSLPTENNGTLGNRDRETGLYDANLNNDGTYSVRKIFDSSPSNQVSVQLNPNTKTADYRNRSGELTNDEKLFLEANQPATAIPTEPLFEDEDANKPAIDPNYANCFGCQVSNADGRGCYPKGSYGAECEAVTVRFSDDTEVRIANTPIRLEYGFRLSFRTSDGSPIEQYFSAPDIVFTIERASDKTTPPDDFYGKHLYSQVASGFDFAGVTAIGISEFQVYSTGCNVAIVAIKSDGKQSLAGWLPCANFEGIYTPTTEKDCLIATQNGVEIYRNCDFDENTILYECVIRVYSRCTGKTVSWKQASDGKIQTISLCGNLTYSITNKTLPRLTLSRADPAFGRLEYTGNINKNFIVRVGDEVFSSPPKANFFQIYSEFGSTGCLKNIVAVSASGTFGFSGASGNLSFDLVTQAPCGGFSIEFGGEPTISTLYVFDGNNQAIAVTDDFIESTISVVDFIDQETPAYEKVGANDEVVTVVGISCS